jgi:predicted Zn-dependent protease
MKLAACLVAFTISAVTAGAAPQAGRAPSPSAQPPAATATDKTAEAYAQFLIAHRLAEKEDEAGAIAAYKRAMDLDPQSADIPAELAGLYLEANKIQEATTAAEQAVKLDGANRQANHVLGLIYAALAEGGRQGRSRSSGAAAGSDEYVKKAIEHLERAIDKPLGDADPNDRATLSRLYLRTGTYDKAIKLLADLVNQEPGWQDGPMLLAEAYAGAGRSADAIAFLEQRGAEDPRLLPALADFYERERRWSDAAAAYGKVLQRTPRSIEVKTRYAQMLLNAGGRDNAAKARDALNDVVTARPTEALPLYLLSQAQRRAGDAQAAEATARRLIAQNGRSVRGYYALAEALEERHQYQAIVTELAPVIAQNRGKSDDGVDTAALLPHLAFAYQELGQLDKAIATFDEARRAMPKDTAIAAYYIEANLAAKKYPAAVEAARAALADNPNDLRLTRLQAQALRHTGKADEGLALLESAMKAHADEPLAYIVLAQGYTDADRGAQAVKVLQDAQTKFPKDNTIAFELGTVFDKQKRFADAEAAFRQVLDREPDNAAALNYLGYMLAERGERLDESVAYLKKALQMEPDNGSYLDSLGWAYFKSDRLELAEDNLRRAADQLKTNSVIQDHYGDVLFKLGRFNDAIAAWNRALTGDGDSIDRGDIDKKIRSARQKLPKN